MRNKPYAMQGRHICYSAHFGKPARAAQIGLRDIDCPRFQRLLETETAMPGFAAGDRDRLSVSHCAISAQLFGNDRFLEPIDIVLACRLPDPYCFKDIIAVIGIDHQPRVGANSFANCRNYLQVLAWVKPDLDLDRMKTGCGMSRTFFGIIGYAINTLAPERTGRISSNPLSDFSRPAGRKRVRRSVCP